MSTLPASPPNAAAAEPPIPALHVAGLSYAYRAPRRRPARVALENLSLDVPDGQYVALLGPNGSGKSTFMKVLCGLLPARGAVKVFGAAADSSTRARLGVVFQSPGLDPFVSVRENLIDQGRLYGMSRRDAAARAVETLARADLRDRRSSLVKTLSGGLARRADLCRALLHHPQILLLDEPTVGLDPSARESFLGLLERLHRGGGLTILMTTHLVDEADRCDRVVLMHEGRIVADDHPAALRTRLGSRRVTVHNGAWTPPEDDAAGWSRSAGGWIRPLEEDAAAAVAMAARLADAGVPFTMAPPTLADVFEHLTGATLHEDAPPPAAAPPAHIAPAASAASGEGTFSHSQESENEPPRGEGGP